MLVLRLARIPRADVGKGECMRRLREVDYLRDPLRWRHRAQQLIHLAPGGRARVVQCRIQRWSWCVRAMSGASWALSGSVRATR